MKTQASPTRAWQRMLSGRRLDLLDPRPEDVAIEDVAHGLARVARWNGQTAGPNIFSVAQHSLLVEAIFAFHNPDCTAATQLAALLHDAAEYVVGDLISPFKAALGTDYRTVENRILLAVQSRVRIGDAAERAGKAIKAADQAAARLEATALAGFAGAEATLFFGHPLSDETRYTAFLDPWPANRVQAAFLERFHDLQSRAEGS